MHEMVEVFALCVWFFARGVSLFAPGVYLFVLRDQYLTFHGSGDSKTPRHLVFGARLIIDVKRRIWFFAPSRQELSKTSPLEVVRCSIKGMSPSTEVKTCPTEGRSSST